MKIYVQANDEQQQEIQRLSAEVVATLSLNLDMPGPGAIADHDAFLILNTEPANIDFETFNGKPVLINEVIHPLQQMGLPDNVGRINAWPGFINRPVWEICAANRPEFETLFNEIGQPVVFVKDTPGMVAPRVIAMIVNEAFYALKEGVSTEKEIDQAMKLGTNYPYGPFEWGRAIGLTKIFSLLEELSQTDKRCIPAFQPETV